MDPENTNNPIGGDTPQNTPPQSVPTPAPADPTPQMSGAMSGEPTVNDSKSTGPIIGSIIIVVIIILGGLYFWGQQLTNKDLELTGPDANEIAAQEDSVLNDLSAQGTSDELADIENDLDTTDLDGLDDELDNIDLDF